MTKIHIDTDIGGDMDDLCALAMVLRWPDAELVGVTTVAEEDGRRAGYARYVLDIEGQRDVPVAAGADMALGRFRYKQLGYQPDTRYWSQQIEPLPGAIGAALKLLRQSIEQGAVIVAIGPCTNLFLLEKRYPGILRKARLVLMGGYIYPIREGYPRWTFKYDWNFQLDVEAAKYVIENSSPLLVTMSVTVETALRRAYLPALKGAGKLGGVLAVQAEEFARDENNEEKHGKTCKNLPDDIINFQHDPLACAIALGWRDGVTIADVPLRLEIRDGWLYEDVHPDGRPTNVVTGINGDAFNDLWVRTVAGER